MANPEAPAKSLVQDHNAVETGTNPENEEPWSPLAHLLRKMAQVPEITFGEFTKSLLQDPNEATGLFVELEKEFNSPADPE